jgi:hypothetical protein
MDSQISYDGRLSFLLLISSISMLTYVWWKNSVLNVIRDIFKGVWILKAAANTTLRMPFMLIDSGIQY